MPKRQFGIGAVVLVMAAIGIWAVLPKHERPSGPVASGSAAAIPVHASEVPGSFAEVKADDAKSNLWLRPAPEVAARNSRRHGFAWILRQLGATEDQINRLADLDIAGVLADLKQKASAGDPASINILGEIALQNCQSRDDATLESFLASQIRDVQAAPLIDASWFAAVARSDVAFYKQVNAACANVDVDEAMSWVTARANQGDGASLWLLYRDANNMTEMQQRLREAAAAGFPEAQFELAWAILGGQEGAAGTGTAKVSAGEMLKASLAQLPRSEMQLAICEYYGCDGVVVDVDAAIKLAEGAARRGQIEAILDIGARLSAGQMDPSEVMAWGLVQASLQQRGCGGNGFSVREMKGISSTLNANNITGPARALAEQYWKDYATQMMKNIGCTP